MGYVCDFGKVEEVGVVAELEGCLPAVVDCDHVGKELDVASAEYTRGADGAGEEVGIGCWAVRGEDVLFGLALGCEFSVWTACEMGRAYLCRCVIVCLLIAQDHGILFVCIDEIGGIVANHARAARVYKRLDARLLRHFDQTLCPINIDLVHQLWHLCVEQRAGGVYDDRRLDLLE